MSEKRTDKMDEVFFVGIDTSNYTTSAALADESGRILLNLKRPLPVCEGQRGLRQSDAVFSHVRNLPLIMDELSSHISAKRIAAVGVSAFPRDAEGSYMPCFLSGVAAAHSFAAALGGVPVYALSHQMGHIMAALYSAEAERLTGERFLAFHVSGGTTEALLVSPSPDSMFSVSLVGGTNDLNAGQAIDRIGVMMGLKFPCGAEMERLAHENTKEFVHFSTSVRGLSCNLSGLENMAAKLYSESGDRALVSAAVFDFVGRTLRKLTEALRNEYGDLPIVYGGGVMSNSLIQHMLKAKKDTYFALPEFSSDNASGIALLCRRKYLSAEK